MCITHHFNNKKATNFAEVGQHGREPWTHHGLDELAREAQGPEAQGGHGARLRATRGDMCRKTTKKTLNKNQARPLTPM